MTRPPKAERHAMNRSARVLGVWLRAIHRMIDADTPRSYKRAWRRADWIATNFRTFTQPDVRQMRWDLQGDR